MRTDTLWKTLGRAHVVASLGADNRRPVLVLTSNLPRPKSEGAKALRAVGPNGIFDAIEMLNPSDVERLEAYASLTAAERNDRPLPGFWTEQDVADFVLPH